MIPREPTTAIPPVNDSKRLLETCERLGFRFSELGVIVVDHGSRRSESNEALLDVVRLFKTHSSYDLVEPAHMELAEPTLEQAFGKLVAAGARFVVVHPYFLLPGRHWAEDIPKLAAQAAEQHPNVGFLVTAPLGIHELMAEIMNDRIRHCLQHVAGEIESCQLCDELGKCREKS